METALPLWETWPTAGLLQNKSCPLMSILNLFHSNLGQLPLILPPCAIPVSDYFPLKLFLSRPNEAWPLSPLRGKVLQL